MQCKYIIYTIILTSLIILLRLKIFNRTKAKHSKYLKFKAFALRMALCRTSCSSEPTPGYRSYFCFPLSAVACKLQVKFLLSFNKLPLLSSREFTPCALGYLLPAFEVKGRCDLFPCPITA